MPNLRCCVRPIGAVVLLFAALAAAPAFAQEKTRTEQAEAQKKLAEVRSKMEALAKEQAETAARRDSANAELAKRANAVAGAAKAVRQTDAELSGKQRELEKLQQDRAALQKNLDGQRAAIADLLRATYTLGRGSDLRLLLGDDDVARVARALAYSKYFQEDRVQKVQKLMGDLARLQDLEARIATEQQALQATKAQRQEQAKTLEQQRAEQARLAAQTDAQYKDQGERLAQLKQNAQSLNSLVDKLQKAIDDANSQVSQAESIRKFVILPDDWTEDNGYLTPSFKVKRNAVLRDFHDTVEALFAR